MEKLIDNHFYIRQEQIDGLNRAARKRGTSTAALIREIFDSFLGIAPKTPGPIKFAAALPTK